MAFGGLFYGIYGTIFLVGGAWWMIGLVVVALALPFYLAFKFSPALGVILVMALTAWVLHRRTRPPAVARRVQKRIARRIKRELDAVPDDLPY